MYRRAFLFIAWLSCATAFAASGPDGPKTTLSGKIIDKTSGQTIPGAEVYFPDLHVGAVSDMDGQYTVKDLPMVRALVKVSMMGYATITETVDLAVVTTLDFTLLEAVTEMRDVVVTGTSRATELKRDPVPMVLVGRSFLREHASTNIMATLAQVPGLSAVGTGPNVSKPVIRGLGGNRVVTLFDGIRQEGQQWGEEHGVEVDQFIVDRAEVVKGPASVMYGSDAMGGVVNLMPAPMAPPGTVRGAVLGQFGSNNKDIGGSVNLDGNTGKLAFGGRASAKAAGNYANRYDGRVFGTKYREKDLSAYMGLIRAWGNVRFHASVYDDLQEIPDGARDSTTGKFTYLTPGHGEARTIVPSAVLNSYAIGTVHQHVQYYRAYAKGSFNLGAGTLSAALAYSRSVRREYDDVDHPDVAGLFLTLNTYIMDLAYHFAERNRWTLDAGLDVMHQVNGADQGTALVIPGYRQTGFGPFVHAKKTIGALDLSAGLRYDVRQFSNDAMFLGIDPATGLHRVVAAPAGDSTAQQAFGAYAHTWSGTGGSIGAAWNPLERLTLKANVGQGYRAPSVAEITAKGIHPGSGLMQLGDLNLRPEFNLQEDLGLFYAGTHVFASLELFNNDIRNYIYNEKLSSATGGDSLYMQGGEAFPVFRFRQTRARLYGGEVVVDLHPHPYDRLHFKNTLSFVYGENKGGGGGLVTDSTRYLPMIPPLQWAAELRYDMPMAKGKRSNLFVSAGLRVVAAQDRFFSAYGTETRTPGYTLVDAGAGADFKDGQGRTVLTVLLAGTNLADRAFQSNMDRLKYFGEYQQATGRTGIYGMGRNIMLRLVVPFNLRKAAPRKT